MNKSESINELAAALAKAQGEIEDAVKDSTNPHFNSSFATLRSSWAACRGPLSRNGLSVAQVPFENEKGSILETILMHSSGQWMSGVLPIRPVRNDPQGYGSALTYMRRYGLQAVVGIAPADDDGEDASNKKGNEKEQTRTAAPTKAPEKKEPKNVTPPASKPAAPTKAPEKKEPKNVTPPASKPAAIAPTKVDAPSPNQKGLDRLKEIETKHGFSQDDTKALIKQNFPAVTRRLDLTQNQIDFLILYISENSKTVLKEADKLPFEP